MRINLFLILAICLSMEQKVFAQDANILAECRSLEK